MTISKRYKVTFCTLGLGLVLLGGVCFKPRLANAWIARHSVYNGEKPLTHRQARRLAQKLVSTVLKRKLFIKEELSVKLELALIPVDIRYKEVTDHSFTDMILNAFLESPKAAVMNLDSVIGETLNLKLLSYDEESVARKRGLMMGADYYVTGSLNEEILTDEKGRVYRVYRGTIQVRNIVTGNVVVEEHVDQNKKNVRKNKSIQTSTLVMPQENYG